MKIEKEVSLTPYNTFGIDAQADWLISYDSIEDLKTLVRDEYFQQCRYLHIGEGSNLLFLANFHGIVLRSEIKHVSLVSQDETSVLLSVGAGMIWDDLVAYCVEHSWYGLENLSLIPGQVGSAAIQNIGAYGVEVEQFIRRVHTLHRRTGEVRHWEREECDYSYRHSIFKQPEQADWIITHVELELSKQPILHLDYADLAQRFASEDCAPSLEAVREAVITIRRSKLPDPKELGNAGSFFMNPVVPASVAEALAQQYERMPQYPQGEGRVKLSAGWLIDQCGLKGYTEGPAGVYTHQALVLINHGGATGTDIARLAERVQQAVQEKFGVELRPEVRYIS
ncbi:UDP-N-acetylmuramate dehydrogenase [Porphyromonas sp. COT-239 OH1446]|uniref:UDP-N-acetylmuramate dehydrogenase n=1 Tax=Porphyromonas sp. COT-239 OH1446 TaxID=1515613 RepID=UPI00052D172C|nr:UDP-N-acetylmuramate dehydrogenase [Porphyromonas sp. COT-239 OH1446]KGN71969.1 UDP-N-acetylenolpyruvoylglucosamine reductase [Porphyromonas sp. COT-239 OH1446]